MPEIKWNDNYAQAEVQIVDAFRLLARAREHLTAGQFEQFISEHASRLGGRNFVTSIGTAILNGASKPLEAKVTGKD